MGNVLRVDVSSGSNAGVFQTISFPGGGWYAQLDVAVPAATFASLLANLSSPDFYTAAFFNMLQSGSGPNIFVFCGDAAGDAAGLTVPATVGTGMGTPGYESGIFTADVWHTIQIHYDGVDVHVTIDSVNLDGNLGGPPGIGNPDELDVGGFSTIGVPGEIYYIRDVKVGTTLGGTDLFADDFSSGDVSGWEGSFGSFSVVNDPIVPDDSAVFGGPVRIGVAFHDTAIEPTPAWTYLTDTDNLVASYQIDRGRQYEFDKTDAGTATVSIWDRNGVLDPTNTAGPYAGLIEPLLQIRIELWNPVTLQYFTRFRGWIENYDYNVVFAMQDGAGDTQGVTRLEISCVDIFEILTAIEMQPDGSFGSTPPTTPVDVTGNIFFDNIDAQGRIHAVLADANIDTAFAAVFTLNVNLQESVYAPSENVLQVIQDAADAEFPTVSNVYSDRLGRLAVHGREAKFDPDGTAVGANWLFTRWKVGDGKAVTASPTDTAHIRDFSYDRGLSKVFNSALCTPNGIGDTDKTASTAADISSQYYSDAGSIAQFGYRSWSAENLFIGALTGDPLTAADAGFTTHQNALDECLSFATYIVENYKTPRNRISQIGFKSIRPDDVGGPANWDFLCQADISDVVEVTVRGPGDSPTGYIFNGEEFFIEGVHEQVTPAGPDYANVDLRLDLSPKAYFPIGGGGGVGIS